MLTVAANVTHRKQQAGKDRSRPIRPINEGCELSGVREITGCDKVSQLRFHVAKRVLSNICMIAKVVNKSVLWNTSCTCVICRCRSALYMCGAARHADERRRDGRKQTDRRTGAPHDLRETKATKWRMKREKGTNESQEGQNSYQML